MTLFLKSNQMTQKKVIVFDPVCGLAIGHNLPTISKYIGWIAGQFDYSCEAWIATDKTIGYEHLKFKKTAWVYSHWLSDNLQDEIKNRRKPIKNESVFDITQNLIHHIKAANSVEDSLSHALAGKPSYVFFPGADFYSLLSIFNLAKKRTIPKETILIIRLMGVMEWATKLPRAKEIVNKLLFQINKLLGDQARFTAETEKYAFELSCTINAPVSVTSIPSTETCKGTARSSTDDEINIACLGGARADKGYFDILELSRETNRIFSPISKRKIRFTVQSMSTLNTDYNSTYQQDLARSNVVKIVKSRLSDTELADEIQAATVILLPYSQGTYASRGSAILFDTLPYGKPILGANNTGFGDTILTAGLGLTYGGTADYINKLSEVMNFSTDTKNNIVRNHNKYSSDMLNNLRDCFVE